MLTPSVFWVFIHAVLTEALAATHVKRCPSLMRYFLIMTSAIVSAGQTSKFKQHVSMRPSCVQFIQFQNKHLLIEEKCRVATGLNSSHISQTLSLSPVLLVFITHKWIVKETNYMLGILNSPCILQTSGFCPQFPGIHRSNRFDIANYFFKTQLENATIRLWLVGLGLSNISSIFLDLKL